MMKLACSVCVGNRLAPTLPIRNSKKPGKSTIALCKNPKSEDFCIILFSSQNKNGTKYNIKNNLQQVFTRFVNEGKATIQFKNPQHDLFIQADAIQLKAFLHLLKRAIENKITSKELTYSGMGVTPIATKDLAPKKLVIQSRSEYPTKGFPRTLETLIINNVRRCSLDRGILNLLKLRVLDLSENLFEFLPEEFNKLNLSELNLSSNSFNKSTLKQWSWMGGNLSKTLQLLKLDSNNLLYLPQQVIKLQKLVNLSINDNQLKTLPFGIGNLRNLKILSASNNQLSILPGSVGKLHLESLDLSNNHLELNRPNQPNLTPSKSLAILTLKEIAARKILNCQIPYGPGIIPFTIIPYLDDAKYCVCGKACLDVFIRYQQILLLENIANSFSISAGGAAAVPLDCYFCSATCVANFVRYRKPVI